MNCHQYPVSLSNPDTPSIFCKIAKNKLWKFLKISPRTVSVTPVNTSKIYDVLVLFQKLPAPLSTINDISDFLMNKFVKGSCRVRFFVKDYYLPNSIKSLARKSRSMNGLHWMKISRRDQKQSLPFHKFLLFSKIDLVKFLINDCSTNTIHAKILEDKELYITVEDNAICISPSGNKLSMMLCNRLSSKQEEADIKAFLWPQFPFLHTYNNIYTFKHKTFTVTRQSSLIYYLGKLEMY